MRGRSSGRRRIPSSGLTDQWTLTAGSAGPGTRADGSIGGLILYTEVITERKLAELALRASEERFRSLVETSSDWVWATDQSGRYTYASPKVRDLLGYEPQEVIGRRPYDLMPPEEAERVERLVRADLAAGRSVSGIENVNLHKDGHRVVLETSAVPIFDVEGNLAGYRGIDRDITDRKQVQKDLQEALARLNATMDALPDLLFVIDREERILDYRAPDPQLLHVPPERFLGRRLSDVLPGSVVSIVRGAVADAIAHGGRHRGAIYPLETEGKVRWFELSIAAQGDPHAPEGYLVMLVRDVTDRKQAEDQLKALNETLEQRVAERTAEAEWRASQLQRLAVELTQAEQRERQRLGQVLHDNLQQLLVAAKFNADSLRRRLTDPDHRKFIQKVDELLGESLATSRTLTAELSPPILYEGNMAQVLHWLGRRTKDKYGLTVTVTADEQADPDSQEVRVLLFQAVRELLLNVTKHARVDRASIRLTRLGNDNVQILVADEGAGFDPEQKQTEQAGATQSSRFGLFGIRERLELMGGRLEIDSRVGQGTQILLTAPCRLVEKQPEAAGGPRAEMFVEAAAPKGGGAVRNGKAIRVMLADDHAVVRDGLARLLQTQAGVEVVGQAADGQQAVDLALQLHPDVILMDVSMPVMGGVEATHRIMLHLPDVRVIGLSMHEQEDVAAQMKAAGATSYLTKTAPPEVLLAAVQESVPREVPPSGS